MQHVDNSIFSKLPLPDKLYRLEFLRRYSFGFWSGNVAFSFGSAAYKGFYHKLNTEHHDNICCIHCGIMMYDFEITDNLYAEHERYSPNCYDTHSSITYRYIFLSQYILDAWFNHFYEFEFTINETLNSDAVLCDAVANFHREYYVRKPCIEYKANVIRELIFLYSNGTKFRSHLTVKQLEGIHNQKKQIKTRFLPNLNFNIM